MVYMEFRNLRQEAYARSLARNSGGGSNKVVVTSTLRDRTPVPQPKELDEAEVKWGQPSSFTYGRNAKDFDQGITPSTSWEIGDPDNPLPPDEDNNLAAYVETWTEVDRKETLVRIDGPDGAYVDFELMIEVKFQLPPLPDGREHFVIQKFKKTGASISPSAPGST